MSELQPVGKAHRVGGFQITRVVVSIPVNKAAGAISGSEVCVELTPNEYKTMLSKEHRRQYVIYVVTQAGSRKEKSHVFYYNSEVSGAAAHVWLSRDGQRLNIKEIIGARLIMA